MCRLRWLGFFLSLSLSLSYFPSKMIYPRARRSGIGFAPEHEHDCRRRWRMKARVVAAVASQADCGRTVPRNANNLQP